VSSHGAASKQFLDKERVGAERLTEEKERHYKCNGTSVVLLWASPLFLPCLREREKEMQIVQLIATRLAVEVLI
jgi:hypothetical protein